MRIALCMSGHVRTLKKCVTSSYFQDLMNRCDVYCTTWEYTTATEHYNCEVEKISEEELKDLLKTNFVKIYDEHKVPQISNFQRLEDNNKMHYMIRECFNYAAHTKRYEILIRTRPDLYLLSDVEVRDANVFNMRFSNMISDVFFYGKLEDMLKVSRYSPIENVKDLSSHWHEKYFTEYIDSLEIEMEHESWKMQLCRPGSTPLGYIEDGKLINPKIPD